MLLLDHPVPFIQRPALTLYYYGGAVTLSRTAPAAYTGPSAEVVHDQPGDDGRYKYFGEIGQWRATLPAEAWDHVGLHYASRPRVRYTNPNFTADRVTTY